MLRSFRPDDLLGTGAFVGIEHGNPGSSPGQAMTTDPATAKTYSYYGSNNQLYTVPSPYTVFSYDALDRLANFNTGAPVTNYVSDGTNPIAEYDGSNVLQKRYAFDGSGQPLVQYDASGNRTWMVGDERGSVIALANDSGAMTSIDTYDEYGIPGAANTGTFQYAGMLWLSRAGLYAPTYRAYGAHLGRFSQTDPIGIAGGVNLYSYVGGDPVNWVDPLGLCQYPGTGTVTETPFETTVTCPKWDFGFGGGSLSGGVGISGGGGDRGGGAGDQDQQQKRICQTQPFKDILSNPAVQQQIAKALDLATKTQNEGVDGDNPANGTEFAFNAYDFGFGGVHVGTTYSGSGGHLREGRVDYQQIFAQPLLFNVRSSYVFMFHTHQSPRGLPGLSQDDEQIGVNVIAVQPNGEVFCAPAS